MTKRRSLGKTIGLAVGIIVLVIIIILVAAGFYFTRISTDYRVFRVGGQGIGSYPPGAIIIASQKFDHPLCLGDLVIYQETRDGRPIQVMGIVRALPGQKVEQDHYLIERPGDKRESVPASEVKWKVIERVK